MEFTKRRNLNRGYMKLEVWQRGMDLFEINPIIPQFTHPAIHQSPLR